MSYSQSFLVSCVVIADNLDAEKIERMAQELNALRERGGTLYIIGLGGSAANASHMAADFRKLCQIDARSLDSMAEVTARANDEGFETIFDGFLLHIHKDDALFVLSVGGGTENVSRPLMSAVGMAKFAGALVFGIVGPHGGYTAAHGDCVIRIPATSNPTPYTEAFQAVIWHLLVSHPLLQRSPTKW